VPEPEYRQEGEDHIFHWHQLALTVTVSNVRMTGLGPKGEVDIWTETMGHLHEAGLLLTSTSGKTGLAKAMERRVNSIDWSDVVETIAWKSHAAFKEGEPLEVLLPERRPESGRFAVHPLFPEGQPSLLFGDGKTGKSLLALGCCLAMALGQPLAGMTTAAHRPAFLDWEWEKAEHADRLLRLGQGNGFDDCALTYRRCSAPLQSQAQSLKRKLDQAKIDYLVIDSLGLACGGNPNEPDIALAFFGAVRYLNRPCIIIHHVTKEPGAKKPFGSAYIRNSARTGWRVSRGAEGEAGTLNLALTHEWTNTGQIEAAIGLRLTFDEVAYTTVIERTEAKPVLRSAGEMNKKQQVLSVIEEHPGMEAWEIAAQLDDVKENIAQHLTQLKKQGRLHHDQETHKYYARTNRAEGQ